MDRSYELIIMQLVTAGGGARSSAMEAIRAARKGDFQLADEKMADAKKELATAHGLQTDLLQKEAGGTKVDIGLLMVHAQDHLMNAMTVYDLAVEMIEMCRGNVPG